MTRHLSMEAMVFVADQHRDRTPGFARLFERRRNSRRIGIILDQVIIDAESVEKRFGVHRSRILRDAVTRPAPIADHEYHWNVEAQRPAPQRISRFHQAGILYQYDRRPASRDQS